MARFTYQEWNDKGSSKGTMSSNYAHDRPINHAMQYVNTAQPPIGPLEGAPLDTVDVGCKIEAKSGAEGNKMCDY